MQPPMVATHPDVDNKIVQSKAPVSKEDGLAVLKAAFPSLEDEQIQTFYELNGFNADRTKAMINEQMGIYTEEEEEDEGIDPADVEFQMLAGQMDPNAISPEERKMIEQALRESNAQEAPRQVQRQVHNNVHHAVNSANIHQQQQRQNPEVRDEEIINNSELRNGREKQVKMQKKVDKKDGNQCCTIF